jgi:hypothetical protein
VLAGRGIRVKGIPAHPGLLKEINQTALRGLEVIGGRIEGREMVAA